MGFHRSEVITYWSTTPSVLRRPTGGGDRLEGRLTRFDVSPLRPSACDGTVQGPVLGDQSLLREVPLADITRSRPVTLVALSQLPDRAPQGIDIDTTDDTAAPPSP